jgi:hypothetical protein
MLEASMSRLEAAVCRLALTRTQAPRASATWIEAEPDELWVDRGQGRLMDHRPPHAQRHDQ